MLITLLTIYKMLLKQTLLHTFDTNNFPSFYRKDCHLKPEFQQNIMTTSKLLDRFVARLTSDTKQHTWIHQM